MGDRHNGIEETLIKELHKEAEEIEKEVDEACVNLEMSAASRDRLRVQIDETIEKVEKERVYSQLSDEDREALSLGRKVQKKRRRRKPKVYVSFAAVLVLVLAIGIGSTGEPERILRFIKFDVGEREVLQVDSSKENAMSIEEKEEEAYDKIAKKFGIQPVKIMARPTKMMFERLELQEGAQTAELIYTYGGEQILFFINASYSGSSWGVDVEEGSVEDEIIEIHDCKIEISKRPTKIENKEIYSAQFQYNGIEYFLSGIIEKGDFTILLENLHFS